MSELEKVIAATSRPCAICRKPRNCALNGELQTVCYECIHLGRHAIEQGPDLKSVVAEELGLLRQAATAFLRKWGGHSGSCCTFDNNGVPSLDGNYQVIVTRDSCKCPPINKALRDALDEWAPREWERQP